jgi:hypothetical protein
MIGEIAGKISYPDLLFRERSGWKNAALAAGYDANFMSRSG